MSINGASWRSLPLPDTDDTITIHRETKNDIPAPIWVTEESGIVIPFGWTTEGDRLRVGFAIE